MLQILVATYSRKHLPYKRVEKELNKDSRLDINNPTENRPPMDNVLEEIQRTRSKHNKHQNKQEDAYKKKTPDDFPFLGIITNSKIQEKVSPYLSSLGQMVLWT